LAIRFLNRRCGQAAHGYMSLAGWLAQVLALAMG
jgi:hypothetical protein